MSSHWGSENGPRWACGSPCERWASRTDLSPVLCVYFVLNLLLFGPYFAVLPHRLASKFPYLVRCSSLVFLFPWEDYLVLDACSEDPEPFWMHNWSMTNENWLAVETELLIPSCVPEALQEENLGLTLQVNGLTDLLPAAIKRGTFLTAEAIKALVRVLNADVPAQGRGSGKNGNVVKLDLAKSLVEHLFPTEPADEKARMVNALMGRQKAVNPEILQIVSGLDAENAEDQIFKKMKKQASEELQRSFVSAGKKQAERERRPPPAPPQAGQNPGSSAAQPAAPRDGEMQQHEAARARAHAEHKKHEQQNAERLNQLTPPTLRSFLPGGGTITDTFSIEYHPVQKHFRVKYPCGSA